MPSDIMFSNVAELVKEIEDGAKITLVKNDYGVPMEQVRGVIRNGTRGLHLICVPTGGIGADLLVGAGCVDTIETSGVTLDEFGQAPAFCRAILNEEVTIKDSTCPAIYAALQAAEKGIPFIPLRGIIGSDLMRHRSDWKIINNPFLEDDPIVLLEAIVPDFALIHAPSSDSSGNLYIGERREISLMAHAAKKTLATVEEVVDTNFLDNPTLRPGVLPAIYVHGVAVSKGGTYPLNLPDVSGVDSNHLSIYSRLAVTKKGFEDYLDEFVFGQQRAAE